MSDDDKAEGEGFVIKDSRSSQLSEEEAESHDNNKKRKKTHDDEYTSVKSGKRFKLMASMMETEK